MRRHRQPTSLRGAGAVVALVLCLGACTSTGGGSASSPGSVPATAAATPGGTARGAGAGDATDAAGGSTCTTDEVAGADATTVAGIVDRAVATNDLHAVLYRVTRGDQVIAAGVRGESIAGQPVTPTMRFRGGNVAFAYLGTLLLLMAESGEVTLDDPVSRWLPDLDVPDADQVTLRMLTDNTSGYPDFVRSEDFQKAYLANPFASFTPDQLLAYAFATPPWYAPGEAWNYAHTNYVILGQALAAAGHAPLEDLLTRRVIGPMGLTGTTPVLGTDLPPPVLQTYSAERDVYENTTWWNPSWQTAPGSVLSTEICDLATSARAVGRGDLLTPASQALMLDPHTAQLGPPPATCPADVCRQMTPEQYYGLGVVVSDGWIVQRPLFSGMGAVQAYLPSADLAVAVVAVAGPTTPAGTNQAQAIWTSIAGALTPDAAPAG